MGSISLSKSLGFGFFYGWKRVPVAMVIWVQFNPNSDYSIFTMDRCVVQKESGLRSTLLSQICFENVHTTINIAPNYKFPEIWKHDLLILGQLFSLDLSKNTELTLLWNQESWISFSTLMKLPNFCNSSILIFQKVQ